MAKFTLEKADNVLGATNWLALKKTLDANKSKNVQTTSRPPPRKGPVKRRVPGKDSRAKPKRELAPQKDLSSRDEVWFDDMEIETTVDGEIIAKQPTKQSCDFTGETSKCSLVTGSSTSLGQCIALDCEMVGGGVKGSEYSMLARCSIVNHHGNVIYDKYARPLDAVVNYRTKHSGIRPSHLENAEDFSIIQKEVSSILSGRTLVGHGLHNDLRALFLSHPKKDIRDTSKYKPFRKISCGGTPSLKKLAETVLNLHIQGKEHDSVEDARVVMKLYQLRRIEWERSLKSKSSLHSKREAPRSDRKVSRWEVMRLARRKRGKLKMKDKRKEAREELLLNADKKSKKTKQDSKPFHVMLDYDV